LIRQSADFNSFSDGILLQNKGHSFDP
jgi:hypothetical protein